MISVWELVAPTAFVGSSFKAADTDDMHSDTILLLLGEITLNILFICAVATFIELESIMIILHDLWNHIEQNFRCISPELYSKLEYVNNDGK